MKNKQLIQNYLFQQMLECNRKMIQLRIAWEDIELGRYDEMTNPIHFVAEHDFHYDNHLH